MALKPAFWYPIAVGLCALNLIALGFAAGSSEVWHPASHGVLAVAFGLWAQRLRQRRGESEVEEPLDPPEAIDALESEVDQLRQELREMQERLDFAERRLAQGPDVRRADRER